MNPILNTDSYKFSHFLQYPPGTEFVSSYIEARGCKRNWEQMVMFGLAPFLKTLAQPITHGDIEEAAEIAKEHGVPFNRDGWEYILDKYKGKLPLEIWALPEGSVVDIGTPLVQVINLDKEVPWLTAFVETALLRAVWYPVTVATQSWHIRKALLKAGYSRENIPFAPNDFGSRGVSSVESCAIGGAAHLVSFQGTDNLAAIDLLRKQYNAPMAGYSVIAAEHSTITSWGRENEVDAYRNMLSLATPGSIISVVSDSYDIYNACTNLWGGELKNEVMALRDIGARLVVRPDSGDPLLVPHKCVALLMEKFGYSTKDGYKILPDYIRVLQGDGINEMSISHILLVAKEMDLHPDNFVFGMGGAMLQGIDRDTLQFAMKTNAIRINGKWHDVYKDPVHGGKTSKRGRQAVIKGKAVRLEDMKVGDIDELRLVFYSGLYKRENYLDEIRERALK